MSLQSLSENLYIDDGVIDYVINPIAEFFGGIKAGHYKEHGYSNSEKQRHVNNYLKEQANDCFLRIYEVAQQKDASGLRQMNVSFSKDALRHWNCPEPWEHVLDYSPNVLPEEWMSQHNLPSDNGELSDVMRMALCQCVATAFQKHGFSVNVYETAPNVWAMDLTWQ